jgi:hypothetical protein
MQNANYCLAPQETPQNTRSHELISRPRKRANSSSTSRFDPALVNAAVRQAVLDTIASIRGGGNIKGRINKASQQLGLTYDRTLKYYWGRVKRIEAHEALQILESARAVKRENFLKTQEEQAKRRQELAEGHPLLEWFLPPVLGLPDAPESEPENRETEG